MSISAWLIRSLDTTGPIVVSELCSAIGPNRAWSAFATSPSSPLVGIWVLPPPAAPAPGEAPADADGPGLADGDADALADADADGAADDDGAAEPDGATDPEADAAGEPDA